MPWAIRAALDDLRGAVRCRLARRRRACRHGVDSREIADSDLIVVWGGNPVSTQVNVMTHISRARKQRGATLVVVDPYRTGTAEVADIHLMPRPGTDGALACAVMHVLFKEGFADRDYLARYTDVPAELEAHLAEPRRRHGPRRSPACRRRPIVDFARLYGRTKRSFIRVGYGFTRSRNGAAQLHAVTCLPAVTGAWRDRGGGALYSQWRALSTRSDLDRGARRSRSARRACSTSRASARS